MLHRYGGRIAAVFAVCVCVIFLPAVRAEAAGPRIAVCGTSAGDLGTQMKKLGAVLETIDSETDISDYEGLLIPGGQDLDPSIYGAKPAGAVGYDKSFDTEQLRIIDNFVHAGKPILGVCRGAQILNVYFGGTLNQNISGHRGTVSVTTTSGSILRTLCGTSAKIICGHHQSVRSLGKDLVITMQTSGGTVEGFEHAYLPILAIQWHPDEMGASNAVANNTLNYFIHTMCEKKQYGRGGFVKLENDWYSYADGVGTPVEPDSLLYRTHVQSIGWMNYVKDGQISGTSGQSLRMEAMNLELVNTSYPDSGITYQTHVQTYGWMGWKSDGAMTGTSGEGKRMEAIRIKLTGPIADEYDVFYRTHAQHYGWLGWAKNGQAAGTAGYAYRLEAIEIRLVKKGEDAPEQSSSNLAFRSTSGHSHEYVLEESAESTCTENGHDVWGCYCGNKKVEETSAASHDYEEISRSEADCETDGSLTSTCSVCGEVIEETLEALGHEYEIVQSLEANCLEDGWIRKHCTRCENEITEEIPALGHQWDTGIVADGMRTQVCLNCGDTTSKEVSISASVAYRTHVQKIGWQNYVTDGLPAGTTGRSLRLEGINIKLTDLQDITGGIRYKTHVQSIGWQNWVENDAMSGTSGRSLRLEAIQIELTGEIADLYDVYYCVHSQTYGWLNWAKNGEMSGTSGCAKRLEAIEICLVEKGGAAPEPLGRETRCAIKQ